jgi:glycine/D-amino acid oxidase-like deaminating enzyme
MVVGGSYTGLSASIALAKMGHTVIIFEALRLGDGASCRNGGLLGPSFGKLGIEGYSVV